MNVWLRQHARSALDALVRFFRTPLASALNVIVIGVTLALPLAAWVIVQNGQRLSANLRTDAQLSVFLATDAGRADVAAVEGALKAARVVSGYRFVSREAALVEIQRTEGLADIAASLTANPLPDAFVAQLTPDDPAAAEALADALRKLPRVAQVQLDLVWLRRLDALLRAGATAAALLAGALALGLVAVTFNTIRLQILTQRDEIEVAKLVGATDAYVRRPFHYQGALLGLAGGVFAVLAVAAGTAWIDADVAKLAATYGSDFALRLPSSQDLTSVVVFASAMGWFGAAIAVSKHLHSIQPR